MPASPTVEPDALIAELIRAKADITLSLRRVLGGFVERMGGPEKLGSHLADLATNPEVSYSAQAAIMTNMAKLMGLYGEDEEDCNELTGDAQIDAYERQLQKT
jgi:hypothetical protein